MVRIIVLALIDTRMVVTKSLAPMFSAASWKLKDGGTTGYTGFGYCLIKQQELQGEHGPKIWFWFTSFTFSHTTKHLCFQWLGTP